MLMITLYAEQKKRHRCTEQSFRPYNVSKGLSLSDGGAFLILTRAKELMKPKKGESLLNIF